MISMGLAYSDVGQPRFFLLSGKARTAVFRLFRGVSPSALCSAESISVREPDAQPAPARGCSRGLGCYLNKQKQTSGGNAGSLFRAFVGTNALLAKERTER